MYASTSSSIPLNNMDPSTVQNLDNDEINNIIKNDELSRKRFLVKEFFKSKWEILKHETRALFTFHPNEWINAFRRNPEYPFFTLGDIDGFVALFMNNLATLLAVILGLRLIFDPDIIYGKIIPGYYSK
jgi:hypothetical protein